MLIYEIILIQAKFILTSKPNPNPGDLVNGFKIGFYYLY
jgi:hypothetical protein